MKNTEQTIRKQTLILRTPENPLFEEARFLLRDGAAAGESEMVKEANRILSLYNAREARPVGRRAGRPPSPFFYFLSGVCCGLIFMTAAAALLSFFR